MRPCVGTARARRGDSDNESSQEEETNGERETRGIARGHRTDDRYTPFSFVRRGEIETANRVGVDEGEGRERGRERERERRGRA